MEHLFFKNFIMSECCGHSHEEENIFYSSVKIDERAHGFDAQAYDPNKDDIVKVSTDDLKGKWTVLFFYPGDFTFVQQN